MNSDNFMGFSPEQASSFKSLFERPQSTRPVDPDIYTTSPSDSVAEDGHYRSKVRVLFNPFNPEKSIVNQVTYYLNSIEGGRLVLSKSADGSRDCPIVNSFMSLWRNPEKKDWARSKFDRTERKWALVQILDDENKPELKGRIMLYRLAKDILTKMQMLMAPAEGTKGKAPYPVMDYLVGLELDIDVTPGPDDPKQPSRKQREISYNLSQFSEYAPIIKIDGTPLFEDSELELIDNYVSAANDARTGKTEAKRIGGQKALSDLRPQIMPLYNKAIDYLKTNALNTKGEPLDPSVICAYHDWDSETKDFVNKWLERVKAMVDPMTTSYEDFIATRNIPQTTISTTTVPEAPKTEATSTTKAPVYETDPNIPF